MTPLSCNCLSRPAPSLVILCSEPTRRSPGIVSCSGSHQPVQTLTPLPPAPPTPPFPTRTYKPNPLYSPARLFCRGRSCWCSPLAVPLADSARLRSELAREVACPPLVFRRHPYCRLHKLTFTTSTAAKKKKTLDLTSYSVTPHFIATLRWLYGR